MIVVTDIVDRAGVAGDLDGRGLGGVVEARGGDVLRRARVIPTTSSAFIPSIRPSLAVR
jgi:hypothetical protein